MTNNKPTPKEVADSLTGFDEIAIKHKFGSPLKRLADEDETQFMRALVFVLRKRDGKKDDEAFHIAQTLTLGDMAGEFRAEDDEADFDEQPPTTKP